MAIRANKTGSTTGVALSGHWNLFGVVHQLESLPVLHHFESGHENLYHIDCSEIKSVDMSGLQLLYTWMQCVSMRGVKPALINLPEGMHQTIRQLGLEKCFSDFYTDVQASASFALLPK